MVIIAIYLFSHVYIHVYTYFGNKGIAVTQIKEQGIKSARWASMQQCNYTTDGIFNLHMGCHSVHRGSGGGGIVYHQIQRTVHFFMSSMQLTFIKYVSMFGHWNSNAPWEIKLGTLSILWAMMPPFDQDCLNKLFPHPHCHDSLSWLRKPCIYQLIYWSLQRFPGRLML